MPTIDLTSACVAQYKMNDNAPSLVVLDAIGGGDGTAQQDTSLLTAAGQIGSSLTFNGTTDYIDTGRTFAATFQDSFSINLWFNATATPSVGFLFGLDDSDDNLVEVGAVASDGDRYFGAYHIGGSGLSTRVIGTAQWATATWYMLTVNFEKLSVSTMRVSVYLDGVLLAASGILSTSMGSYAGTDFPYIGDINSSSPSRFAGYVDNVCIFNRVLTQDEIDFLYNSGDGTELLRNDEMAITKNAPTVVTTAHGARLVVNATTSDCQGNEELVAAPGAGYRIVIKRFSVSMATATTVVLNYTTTALIGPHTFTTTGIPWVEEYPDSALVALPENTALNMDAAASGVVTITLTYEIQRA